MATDIRQPTQAELRYIEAVLRKLRDHFPEWPGYEGNEHELIAFALYEGCGDSPHCGEILAHAAPFAIGYQLVKYRGYRWVMIMHDTEWHYGVEHPLLEPIDLQTLETEPCRATSPSSPVIPGRKTLDAYAGLVNYSRGRRRRAR